MSKSKFTGTKRTIALFICSILCMLVCIAQIVEGCRMIKENNDAPPLSTKEDYDSFKDGQIVNGVVSELLFAVSDDENNVRLYFAATETKRIISFRCPNGSELSMEMNKLANGEQTEVYYKGKVGTFTDLYSSSIKKELTINYQLLKSKGVNISAQDVYTGLVVDMSPTDAGYSDKAITATFVGAVLMLLLSIVFLIYPVKNAYQTIAAEKGKYKPKLAVTKDDIKIETQGYYNSDEIKNDDFFVNTEYNIRDYGVHKDDSPADRSQLPTTKDDPAMNRSETGEALFYTGEVNEEGNFYVDSKREASTEFGKETQNKRY